MDHETGPTRRNIATASNDSASADRGATSEGRERRRDTRAPGERVRVPDEAAAARAAADLERRRLLAVLEQLPVGVHVAEAPSGKLVLDNAAIRAICGEAPRSEGVSEYSADYAGHFPPGHPRAGEPLSNDEWPMSRALATGEPVAEELVEIRRGDGTRRLVGISATPVRDAEGRVVGAVATSVDMTERERLRAAEHLARARAERLQALTAALSAARTVHDVARVITTEGRRIFQADSAGVALLEDGGGTFRYVTLEGVPDDIVAAWDAFPNTPEIPFGHVVATREPLLLDSLDELGARFPSVREPSARMGIASMVVLPLVGSDGEALGAANLSFNRAAALGADDVPGVVALAQQCALALERARLFEGERAARAESEAARAQLEQQMRLFEGVVSTTPDFVYLFDLAGRFQYANRRLLEVWGVSLHEAVGRTCLELGYEQWHHDMHMREIAQVIATKQPISGEVPFRAPRTGIFGVYEYIFTPVLGPDGEVTLVAGTTRDVTSRKHAGVERERLLAEAEAARREAESANRAKGEFLAVMSHELRTPLNAIGGYAELLEMGIRGPITAQQGEDLRRIQASQRHLLGLINEVLNYAKLETGTVHYELASISARDTLMSAEALISPQARLKELTLTVTECSPTLAVRADGEKLRQIVVNLLSNAVKFTDRGGRITLWCEAVGDEAGGVVRFCVRDSGIGIAAEHRERIFDPFVQVRADLTRRAEGTGLGLAISRDLARGMGGDLTVESVQGEGSTFTLSLPMSSQGAARSIER